MELIILAGVGLAGYGLSGAARRPVVSSGPYMTHSDAQSLGPGGNAQMNKAVAARQSAMYDADFMASRDPCATGVIPANEREVFHRSNQPFYRSDKSAATSDAYKQGRMELFTGELEACRSKTGTYQPKRENGPMFDPAIARQPVTSSGRQAYVDLRESQDEERYQVGMKHHGSGPTAPMQVGPGLGLAADVPAAGGFQQFFRVCPENVNGYRKNPLPGRIIPGSAPIPGAANIGSVNHKAQRPVWEQGLTAGRAAATAPACYGQQPQGRRDDSTEGFVGHAFGGLQAPSSTLGLYRARPDDQFHGTVLNAAGQGVQGGGYVGENFMDPGAFRNAHGPLPAGAVRGTECGGFQTNGVQAGPTQREQQGFQPFVGNMQTGQAVRNQQSTRAVTGRDVLDQRHFMTGTAAGPPAPALTLDTGMNWDKPETCVGYTPNGVSQNMWEPQGGTERLRSAPNAAHMNLGGYTSVDYARPGDNQRCMDKLPITANLDLGLAKNVLNQNPLTHKIFA